MIASFNRVNEALEIARDDDFDFAVLDIDVAGTQSYPVADILRKRGIPFVFASGYGAEVLLESNRDDAILGKPYQAQELEMMLSQACNLLG